MALQPQQNYQFAYSALPPPKPGISQGTTYTATGGNLGQIATAGDSTGVTKQAVAQQPRVNFAAGGILGGGGLSGGAMGGTTAQQGPLQPPPKPGISGNQPPPVPDKAGLDSVGAGAGGVQDPSFAANPLVGDPMAGSGEYEDPARYKWGSKVQIANPEAFNIGPYYGYAFDAGERSLKSGYSAASTLAGAGTESAQLGMSAGDQLAASGQDFGHRSALVGKGAWQASGDYADALGGYAGQLGAQGGQFIDQGAAAGTRNIADVNLKASNAALGQSSAYANQLAGIGAQQGPSAAQAQLQSALNQSNAQNLAMARSGRGWGGSASAQSQALAANAAAGQQAANASAVLRAQEEQQRLAMLSSNVGQAAQLQQSGAQTALSQQQLAAQTNLQEAQQQAQQQQALYALGQQGLTQAGAMTAQQAQTDLAGRQAYLQSLAQAGQLEMGGIQGGATLGLQGIGQGAGLYAQGQQMAQGAELQAMQFASQQQQALQAQANNALQQYGIQKGVAIQQQQATNQLIGAGMAAAATLAPLALSDKTAKTDIKPLETKNYALDFRPNNDGQPLADFGLSQASKSPPLADFGLSQAKNPAAEAQASADLAANQGKAQAIGAGLGGAIQGFMAPTPINPMLAQSMQGVGAGSVMSDRSKKTDIARLDAAESDAIKAIQSAGKSGQLAALDRAGAENVAAIRGAPGMAAQAAFDQTPAYSYQYKQPEKYGEGEFVGLMAQDLAKSPAGSTAVVPQADGKLAVDMNRLGMLTAAAQSQTQERQEELEKKLARLQRRVLSQQANADGTY